MQNKQNYKFDHFLSKHYQFFSPNNHDNIDEQFHITKAQKVKLFNFIYLHAY